MLYKNNGQGLKFPVRGEELSWVTFKEGESKELSEREAVNAELHGLVKAKPKEEVKAVESSIGKKKVETKKIKSKKKKKGE